MKWTTGTRLKQYDKFVMIVEHAGKEFILNSFYINRDTGSTGYFDTKFVKNQWPDGLPKANIQGDRIRLKVKAVYHANEYDARPIF